MVITKLLENTLDDMDGATFRQFQRLLSKDRLSALEDFEVISKGRLENKTVEETVDQMAEFYTDDGAATVTLEILELMRLRNAAHKLKARIEAMNREKAASLARRSRKEATSSYDNPHLQTSRTARDVSILNAPVISGKGPRSGEELKVLHQEKAVLRREKEAANTPAPLHRQASNSAWRHSAGPGFEEKLQVLHQAKAAPWKEKEAASTPAPPHLQTSNSARGGPGFEEKLQVLQQAKAAPWKEKEAASTPAPPHRQTSNSAQDGPGFEEKLQVLHQGKAAKEKEAASTPAPPHRQTSNSAQDGPGFEEKLQVLHQAKAAPWKEKEAASTPAPPHRQTSNSAQDGPGFEEKLQVLHQRKPAKEKEAASTPALPHRQTSNSAQDGPGSEEEQQVLHQAPGEELVEKLQIDIDTTEQGTGHWGTRLCECGCDCYHNCCCFSCMQCQAVKAFCGCPLWPVVDICTLCVFSCCFRHHVRKRYDIKGSHCGDLCTTVCCYPCAWCQMSREVKKRESDDAVEQGIEEATSVVTEQVSPST